MKINQNMFTRVEQNLLQGFDLQMVQNVHALPGVFFSDFITEYCNDHRGLKVAFDFSATIEIDLGELKKDETLYDHLAFQIEISFNEDEKEEALAIAASLDHNGFYEGEVTPVLKKMWQLDPIGIAASSVQETLLIQLLDLDGENQLAEKILRFGYKYFLVKDIKRLSQINSVSIEEVENAFIVIKGLDPFPGRRFEQLRVRHVVPEMILSFDGKWDLKFVKEFYPSVQLLKNGSAKEMMNARRFIYQLHQRKNRLEWIVSKIVKRQEAFLLGRGEKGVLSRKEVLKELDISESTLSRILSEKYIDTPIGLFPLGYFFSRPTATISVDQTVEKAKEILKEIIDRENKKTPYPDEILKDLLLSRGVICSRRSVAKYRKGLNISGAYHRACR